MPIIYNINENDNEIKNISNNITIIYNINENDNSIKIFGEEFVENNKKIVIY